MVGAVEAPYPGSRGISALHLPEWRIATREPRLVDLKQRRVLELRRFVPVLVLSAPFVTLIQHAQGGVRYVEPGDGYVRTLTNREVDPPKLEKIGRGSEAEVEIDAAVESRDRASVQQPAAVSEMQYGY